MPPKPPQSLERLIHGKFLRSALIPLFAIEVLLLALYFGISTYISRESQSTLVNITTDNVRQTLSREAQNIDHQLKEVSRLARIMQRDHEQFYSTLSNCKLSEVHASFARHANGVYYKDIDNGGASLYYAATTLMGPEALRKAACSEQLDTLLKSIVDGNPIVTQAYLNTFDNMNRLYPFMPDAPTQYGPGLQMQDYNFYYLADAKHDPQRDVVWTEAYLDPAGQGWMMSAVVPIYHDGKLEGVSGLDVTIDAFVKTVLSLKLPWPAGKFMVDSQGVILAMSPATEELLGLKELKNHVYNTTIDSTVVKPSEYNLHKLKDPALRERFSNMLDRDKTSGSAFVNIDGHQYLLRHDTIPETGWKLMTMVNEDTILAPVVHLRTLSNRIGWAAIAIMVIFYTLFFFYLLAKARSLAVRIARPIERLSDLTGDVGTDEDIETLTNVGIREIDALSHNFNTMLKELSTRSEQLVQSRVREELRIAEHELLTRLATSDALTGLANRRKAEELMRSEVNRVHRYKETFGLIFLDIDMFKSVNDTYGHATGDEVLRDFAQLLKSNVRISDVVTRWGGEEFVVICINVDTDELRKISEKLRQCVENHNFSGAGRVTTSVGASLFAAGDSPDDVMERADQALYEAKNSGRNCCRFNFKEASHLASTAADPTTDPDLLID